MTKPKLLFDLSSLLWTCLLVGKDPEGTEVMFEGKPVHVNSAPYGYEHLVNAMTSAMTEAGVTPLDCILVPEGMNSKSGRLLIDRSYKANRGKRPQEAYQQFNILKDQIIQVFRDLGAIAVKQDNVEADDVIAWLAKHTKQNMIIVTNDNDLSALNMTNEFGADIKVRVDGILGSNKYGMFPCRFITLYKSLVGDTSDGISGIKGFGPKAWLTLDMRFGEKGMDYLEGLVRNSALVELEADARKDPFIKKLFDGRMDFERSYKLARLRPEWINTLRNQLHWMPGFTHGNGNNDERLRKYRAVRRLVTSENWESFVPWLLQQIRLRDWYAMDIETSTPVESDDWLAAMGKPDAVDTIGSTLTGMSLTLGINMQYTVYISVDHANTKNVSKAQLFTLLKAVHDAPNPPQPVIHNTMFEGPVLYHEFGEQWKDNGYHGLYPNWLDTKLESSYVDEDSSHGLKNLSKQWFDYDQVDYLTTTTLEGEPGTLKGGRELGLFTKTLVPAVLGAQIMSDTTADSTAEPQYEILVPAVTKVVERRQYKMRELPATHVFDYACDDTATTSGIHNFCRLFMELENTWDIYKKVEISASYLHAKAFIDGTNISLRKVAELDRDDSADFDQAKQVLDAYLVKNGWEGTVTPVFTEVSTAALKTVFQVVTGNPLETKMRTPAKLVALIEAVSPALAKGCTNVEDINTLIKANFRANPVLNTGSPLQLQRLFYEVMKLPVRVFNKPTDKMRADGKNIGTPKTDNLAIAYALKECDEEQAEVLKAIRIMKMVETRRGLYYAPYPYFVHWKTGRIHSSHNQCATNTRRGSSSTPNFQQLSKNMKVEGFIPRVREIIIPHKRKAVIVSLDFKSQEIVLMAEWSQDPGLLALFGDNPKDMHSITGVGIFNAMNSMSFSYEEFVAALDSHDSPEYGKVKAARALGKAVNFGSQYRIAAKKLSSMLFVVESEAQVMLDAKAEAFPVAEEWSLSEMKRIREIGTVTTLMGAVRHLTNAVTSSDRIVAGKAERQALSFRIQGSAAEQTKLAEGRVWDEGILEKYDCAYVAPVHDELVFSVLIEDLARFIPEVHGLMTMPYATMKIKVGSSVSIGPSFGQQYELNGDFSQENITSVLASID